MARKKTSVGVDIGSSSIRAVEVQRRGKKVKIVNAAEVDLERGAVVAGEVRDPIAVADAMSLLWSEGGFKGKSVNIGFGGPQTLVRQLDLPWEESEMFREALPLRMAAELPINPSEMTMDFYPLSIYERGTMLMQRSLIVASINAVVENAADALVDCGLRVRRADFSPFALIRAAVVLAGDDKPVPGAPAEDEERSVEVVVEMGAQIVIIAIHDQGRPLYVRIVSGGSEGVTRALAEHLKVTFEVAEALKRKMGISTVDETNMPTDPIFEGLTPQHFSVANQIVNMMAGALVQVVRESVDYFLTVSQNVSHVERVLLTGGGALIGGMPDRLASELRAPVALMQPLAAFGDSDVEKGMDPRMGLAFGLALEADK